MPENQVLDLELSFDFFEARTEFIRAQWAGLRSSDCRVTRRSSTRWSTSGGYWKHHELPNFCPPSSAIRPAARCEAWVGAHAW